MVTVCALTVDKELLLVGQDAGQVRPLQATLPLGRVPRAPVAEVLVAVALELVPAVVARLCVCATARDRKWTSQIRDIFLHLHSTHYDTK